LSSAPNSLSAQFDSTAIAQIAEKVIESELDSIQKAKEELQWELEKDSIIKTILGDSDIKAFNFVGGGDLNSISQNGGNATAGNISLGLHYIREFPENTIFSDIEVDFGINVSSTVDSFSFVNERSFGNYILNPINSRQSARLDFYSVFHDVRKKDSNGKRTGKYEWYSLLFDGAFFRFFGSNALWDFNGRQTHVTALHWKLGLFHELIPDRVARESNSSVLVGIAYGQRAITGDIKDDLDLFEDLFGTRKTTYGGWDIVFSVKFNNIRAEFLIPIINSDDAGNSIRGLTDTQFITQVRFIGGFPLRLNSGQQLADKVSNTQF